MLKSLGTVAIFFARETESNLTPTICKVNAEALISDMVSAIYLIAETGERYQMVACECSDLTDEQTFERLARYMTPETVAHHMSQWVSDGVEFAATVQGCNAAAASLRAEADGVAIRRLAATA